MASFHYEHPLLGNLQGRLNTSGDGQEDVVQFRSIPYATIPRRFAQSELLDKIPQTFDARSPGDFRKFGAACPQLLPNADVYGGPIPGEEKVAVDEFGCLNLTISVPRSQLLAGGVSAMLPVLVYVHGGGLSEGTGAVDGLHETNKLVHASIEQQMPVVIVSICYRLNWLGFMACQDLLDESETAGMVSSEGPFNLGFYDQQKALIWVQNNIAGFGGDPGNVTAFGESAGASSLVCHLASSTLPLFKRVILQSAATFGTATLQQKDAEYQRLLSAFNIKNETAHERLEALRQVPVHKLVQIAPSLSGSPMFPFYGSPSLFPNGGPTYLTQADLLQGCSWVDSLIIGDCQNEGNVLFNLLRGREPKRFVSQLLSTFGSSSANKILDIYNITPTMDPILFFTSLMPLVGDIVFNEPMLSLCDHLATMTSKPIYRYTLALSNPFPGPHHDSHVAGPHAVDMLYLFNTLTTRYPVHRDKFYERQAREMGRRWIAFAYGKDPWERYLPDQDHGGKLAICDDLVGWETRTRKEDERLSNGDPWGARRYRGMKAIKEAFAQLESEGVMREELVNDVRKAILSFGIPAAGETDTNEAR